MRWVDDHTLHLCRPEFWEGDLSIPELSKDLRSRGNGDNFQSPMGIALVVVRRLLTQAITFTSFTETFHPFIGWWHFPLRCYSSALLSRTSGLDYLLRWRHSPCLPSPCGAFGCVRILGELYQHALDFFSNISSHFAFVPPGTSRCVPFRTMATAGTCPVALGVMLVVFSV